MSVPQQVAPYNPPAPNICRMALRSFEPQRVELHQGRGVSAASVGAVVRAVASFARVGGSIFPSVASIAQRAGLSERGTQLALRAAEAAGWIQRRARRGATTLYRVVWDRLVPPELRRQKAASPKGRALFNPLRGLPDSGARCAPPRSRVEAEVRMALVSEGVSRDIQREAYETVRARMVSGRVRNAAGLARHIARQLAGPVHRAKVVIGKQQAHDSSRADRLAELRRVLG